MEPINSKSDFTSSFNLQNNNIFKNTQFNPFQNDLLFTEKNSPSQPFMKFANLKENNFMNFNDTQTKYFANLQQKFQNFDKFKNSNFSMKDLFSKKEDMKFFKNYSEKFSMNSESFSDEQFQKCELSFGLMNFLYDIRTFWKQTDLDQKQEILDTENKQLKQKIIEQENIIQRQDEDMKILSDTKGCPISRNQYSCCGCLKTTDQFKSCIWDKKLLYIGTMVLGGTLFAGVSGGLLGAATVGGVMHFDLMENANKSRQSTVDSAKIYGGYAASALSLFIIWKLRNKLAMLNCMFKKKQQL